MTKQIFMKNFNAWLKLPILMLLVLGHLVVSNASSGQTIQSSSCPVSWLSVIETVARARVKLPEGENIIIFSGPDGEVFNCLDEDIPERDMKQINFFQKSLSLLFSERRLDYPDEEIGYCSYGTSLDEKSPTLYIFTFPYDEIELNSKKCMKIFDASIRNLTQ